VNDNFLFKVQLRELGFDSTKWTSGFWKQKEDICINNTVPSVYEGLNNLNNAAVLRNFFILAGIEEGRHLGVPWADGDCYKWIESAIYAWRKTRDKKLQEVIDKIVEAIGKAQEPDGYIHTYIQMKNLKRWNIIHNHEGYNFGHLLTTASVHKRLTGKDSFLKIAVKAADYLFRVFSPLPKELAHFGYNPSYIMGLVDLYRVTGNKNYIELADIFVNRRGSEPVSFEFSPNQPMTNGGGDQNQDRKPLKEETEAVGHAVTGIYLYAGAADVCYETSDSELFNVLEGIWEDINYRKQLLHGGIGTIHKGVSLRGDPVHEAFGQEYVMHNSTAYSETCANIGNAMFNYRMLKITSHSKYVDALEHIMYNGGLSGQSIDGTRFRYTNPQRWYGKEHNLLFSDTYERWKIFDGYCCPPQMSRTISKIHNWAYSIGDNGIWVNLYGGNELATKLPNGSSLKLYQQTDYPWDGSIKFTFLNAPSDDYSLFLRIPEWSKNVEVKVNGTSICSTPKPGTYMEIRRTWHKNDTVELDIPLETRLIKAHSKVEEARNQVAIMRGPILYCLEQIDLPEDVSVMEIHLPKNIIFEEEYKQDLLGGVTVIKAQALRIYDNDNSQKLYKQYGNETVEKCNIKLVPYYAWNNRGIGEMSIWLPKA